MFLKYPKLNRVNECLGVNVFHKLLLITYVKSVVISNQSVRSLFRSAFQQILRIVCVCLGNFVIMVECRIIALTLWLEKVLNFALRLT